MSETISYLKSVVHHLSKHHSFLQLLRSHLVGVATTVLNEMQKHASILTGVVILTWRKTVSSFAQATVDYFDAKPTFKPSYAP